MDGQHEFHTVRGYQLLGQRSKAMTPAMEDYVEMIYRCSLEHGNIRINLLSELLNVQPPSATHMVQKLTKLELVNYKKYGLISLTKSGRELGKFLYDRHNIIQQFLRNLGAGDNDLTETELIEHSISIFTVNQMMMFNRFIQDHPQFLNEFEIYKTALQAGNSTL